MREPRTCFGCLYHPSRDPDGTYRADGIRFIAEPGERNSVRVWWEGERVVFRDESAPIRIGPGCIRTKNGDARCDLREEDSIIVSAGDRDDVVDATMPAYNPASIRGGDGDDRLDLRGGAGSSGVYGDNGADELHARAGRPYGGGQRLFGGAGDDVMAGQSGADRSPATPASTR